MLFYEHSGINNQYSRVAGLEVLSLEFLMTLEGGRSLPGQGGWEPQMISADLLELQKSDRKLD